MRQIGVAHALVAHLQGVVVIGIDAIVLTPGAHTLEEGAATTRHLVEIVPHLQLKCVVDDLKECLLSRLRHIVPTNGLLSLRFGNDYGEHHD